MRLDGPKIKRLREDDGLTQRDLCRAASISPTFLSQIEGGVRGCSPHVAERLASVLGTSIAELREN